MSAEPLILIAGAGPTGLSAAHRLTELGYPNWLLVDAAEKAGGLAASVVDENGFTWDMGGHVIFSHYAYFDQLLDTLLGEAWIEHIREAWVWMREQFIPYPLQNNIWRLPPDDLIPCLQGLLEVHRSSGERPRPATFYEWIQQNFGEGLAQTFMVPYNSKVWGYHPTEMNVEWMGERVATVDLGRILKNLVLKEDDCGWGPNSKFRFPQRGGTGAIWEALFQTLPRTQVQLGRCITQIKSRTKTVVFADGTAQPYEYLVSTLPMDSLLRLLSDQPDLSAQANGFKYSSSHIVGIGIDGPVPEFLATKCWMYFPEPTVPFYRVTVFSNYAPENVPRPGQQWSLMCEVSETPDKPVNQERIMEQVIAGLRSCRLLPHDAAIVSRWRTRLEYGYPTPFCGRDALLERVEPKLRELGIWSRGRFGAWKYEVSNQDHSVMQGVEAIGNILFGAEEMTLRYPDLVNGGKTKENVFPERRPWQSV